MPSNQTLGLVIKKTQKNTAVVLVKIRRKDLKYQQTVLSRKRYIVDDSENISNPGDAVLIQNCSPVSKRKAWQIIELVR